MAKESALKFNPNVNITSHYANIKDPQFNLEWFKSFDIVMNALDNLGNDSYKCIYICVCVCVCVWIYVYVLILY